VLKQFKRDDTSNAQIAEASDIEVIKNRCPESFGRFYAVYAIIYYNRNRRSMKAYAKKSVEAS
jgi:hypothetical protein